MEDNKSFEELEKDFTAIRDENRKCANTAFRIGSALLSLLALSKKTLLQNKEFSEGVTFLKGIITKAESFFQGIVNKGDIKNNGDITNKGNIHNTGDITNTGTIMTNNLTVTGKATFFELEIQKAKAAGGMSVNSAGTFHIDAVTETKDGFVCYQRAEKDGVTLRQTCEVSDQMMCSNGMNILEGGKGNHFYWRKVTQAPADVVTHTIDGKEEKCLKIVLSKTDHSTNTVDIPQVGDDLVQMGNPDNKERQSIIMTCAYNSFDGDLKAPYWVQYTGVNTYELSKFKRTWFAANGSQVTGNFKVQSDNGGLKSIEDYMKGLATNTYKLVMSGSQFNVKADGSLSPEFISIYAYKVQGENLTQLSPSEKVKVVVTKGENNLPIKENSVTVISGKWNLWAKKEDMNDVFNVDLFINDKLVDKQKIHVVMDGKNGQDGKDGVDGKDGINGEKGTDGKDAITYKLIPLSENVVAYISEDKETKVKTNKVDVRLLYKIMKSAGEQVNFTTLTAEEMTLTIQPSVGNGVAFTYNSGAYGLSASIKYVEIPDNSYTVTLKKGSEIVDQRIVPITMKPKVVFDIDTVNGTITSSIEDVNGNINSIERDIKQTKATVGELDGKYSQLKMKSDSISLTVNNGTRPNLLWGSDLDLSEVQDKIILAHKQGDIIKQETAKKEELQRQLNATPTNDTAKRNELQTKINVCDNDITKARNKVSECRAAIEKHLGVGLNVTKVDNTEWFEYLKGGGVAGADAIKAKVTAVNDDGNYYAGLYWQIGFGAKSNVKVKPNTEYTFSFWIRTEILQGSGYAVVESFNMESLSGGRKDRTMPWSDVKATNEWERKSYTFTTGDTGYIMVGVGLSGSPNFSGLIYLCRPKLEEGNTATPWCAYDGTVDALKRTGIDILTGEIVLDADKTTVKGDLTAKSLQTEGDPAKGGGTVVAKDGVITFYGVNKSVPGIEIGLNEAGEPVLKMYKNGKFMYDLGPDTIFEQVIERENGFTPCDMHRICNTAGNDMEKSFRGDFPSNYRTMVAYVFSEGYKRVGNQTRYKVSDTNEISTYNGVHFAEQRSVSGITANELESMSRIADGWYLNGGGPRVSDSSAPAYDGSNPQGYTCRRFGVRYYSNGKATSKLGSFTVCGNSQTGWTVEKIDIPFL